MTSAGSTPSGDQAGRPAFAALAGARMNTVAVMTAQLGALRRQRKGDEHEADQLTVVLNAIARVRRDRDAGSSSTLRAYRAQLEQVCAEVEDMVVAVAGAAVRLHLRGDDSTDPVVRRAHRAIDSAVQAMSLLTGGLESVR